MKTKTRFLLACAVLATQAAAAQYGNNNVPAPDASSGRFELPLKPSEKMLGSYSLSPRQPKDKAAFLLHTPEPVAFRATITNSKGKTVFRWQPAQTVYLYQTDWDLSGLKSGTYTVHLYTDKQAGSVCDFSFTKL